MSQSKEEPPLFVQVGQRIRTLRKALGLSQAELAEKAGVHRTLIVRVEAGEGCRTSSLLKISDAMSVGLSWLLRPYTNQGKCFSVDRIADAHWVASAKSFVRKKDLTSPEALRNPSERNRIGSNGLANAFVRIPKTDLPHGRLRALLVETYQREIDYAMFPGEAFTYVLKGTVRFEFEGESVVLHEGDAIGYWTDRPHLAVAVGDELPAIVLELFLPVSAEDLGERS